MTVGAGPRVSPPEVLDIVSVVFGRLLRERGVAVSPAEVVEVRTVLALLGASRPEVLRPALRAVTVKYQRENRVFDAVFDRLFLGLHVARTEGAAGARGDDPQVGALPDEWELDSEGSSPSTPSDLDPAEIGDLVEGEDTVRRDEDIHYDDSDFSTATGEEEFAVEPGAEQWRSTVTYEIEVDRASSDRVGEMGSSAVSVSGDESLDWGDALDVLRTLDGYDARQVYAGSGEDGGPPPSEQVGMFVDAVVEFLRSLTDDVTAGGSGGGGDDDEDRGGVEGPDDGDLERATHEVMRRIRGAPRRRSRPFARGVLDSRSTLRRAWSTDGEAFTIMNRTRVPGPLKLLILVDVSLSVRPVTGFVLRLAQSLHQKVNRCSVVAFVDRPVDVTDQLLSSSGAEALATVLAAPGLDLEASSDYGRVFAELLDRHGDLIDARTSVLVVGDGRSNGLDPREDLVGRISRRAHRMAWITPEARRYWNRPSCGLSGYARYLDGVVTARDPAELSERAGLLGSSLA